MIIFPLDGFFPRALPYASINISMRKIEAMSYSNCYKSKEAAMKKILTLTPKSQFDNDIEKRFRASACGPVTAHVILNYHFPNQYPDVNNIYRLLGGTRIGLFTWRFIRNMRKLLGNNWRVKTCEIEEVIKQIAAGRPVAAKFDKWFTLKWRGRYSFAYHWVPIIGIEMRDEHIWLIIQDNGGRNRPSQIKSVPFEPNESILTFVKIEPKK